MSTSLGSIDVIYKAEYALVIRIIVLEGYFHVHIVLPVSYTHLQKSCNSLLNISYITLAILFLLSLIILIFFTEIVYLSLIHI